MNLDKVKDLFNDLMELDDYDSSNGELMNLDYFIKSINEGSIMDYDGFGDVIYKGKEIVNVILWVDEQLISFSNNDNAIAFSLHLIKEIYGDDIKICWYNR